MKLNYCPNCAAPLTKKSKTEYSCPNGHKYWNNPRVTVTTVLLNDDGQALFSLRAIEPHKGKIDTPGGFVEFGESAEAAAARELQEETGLIADELTLIGSGSHGYEENITTCDFIFLVRKWHGSMKAADDVAKLEWKEIARIDSVDFAWDYPGLVEKLQSFIDLKQ